MKYLGQFGIIIIISLLGEMIKFLVPLPVPASIYGLILMLSGLKIGIIQLSSVRDASLFLIDIMPLMFIPAAAGLLTSWEQLSPIVIPVAVITSVTTILVMAVSGRATQFVQHYDKRRKAGETHE